MEEPRLKRDEAPPPKPAPSGERRWGLFLVNLPWVIVALVVLWLATR
ncbi:hypothetical protein [Chitinimonas koreensis]|nr:hypothetical protein [Chitinimonas koreensis]QNM96313.1 hypothetical protein H9L41_21365 [Chitinimonas koreensis]